MNNFSTFSAGDKISKPQKGKYDSNGIDLVNMYKLIKILSYNI